MFITEILSLLCPKRKKNGFDLYLSVSNDPDDFAILDHFLEVLLDGLEPQTVLPLLGGLGERLLLGLVPGTLKSQRIPSSMSGGANLNCLCRTIGSDNHGLSSRSGEFHEPLV